MRGHIRKRAGSWEFIIDVGASAAQRCQGCGRRYWLERKPKPSCPKCGGQLFEGDERRRQTKAGFATRKEAEEAMAKVMIAVAEQSYVVPSRVSVREFLLREWLPAIKGTLRPTTFASYTMHCQGHIVPALGGLALCSPQCPGDQRLLCQAARGWQNATAVAASPPPPCAGCMPPCTGR